MAGGPINGVPLQSMWPAIGGAGIAHAVNPEVDSDSPESYQGIIIPTAVQIASDALSYWTSMTCLYDRWWSPSSNKITLHSVRDGLCGLW